jgi:hypothetical protein
MNASWVAVALARARRKSLWVVRMARTVRTPIRVSTTGISTRVKPGEPARRRRITLRAV